MAFQQKRKEYSLVLQLRALLYRWCPSLNNSKLCDFIDRNYLIEFEIRVTTNTSMSELYPGRHIEIYSEDRLRTKLYDKWDYFNFLIVNFPFII